MSHAKTALTFDIEGNMTEQSHKKACDVNQIMKRYIKTGVIDHIKTNAPQYMDVPAIDYTEAMALVASADSMFNELPAQARKHFNNDPAQFLEYVQTNEADIQLLHELGLTNPNTQPSNNVEQSAEGPEGSEATSNSEGDRDAQASEAP